MIRISTSSGDLGSEGGGGGEDCGVCVDIVTLSFSLEFLPQSYSEPRVIAQFLLRRSARNIVAHRVPLATTYGGCARLSTTIPRSCSTVFPEGPRVRPARQKAQ